MGSEELGSCGLASVEPLCLFGTAPELIGTLTAEPATTLPAATPS